MPHHNPSSSSSVALILLVIAVDSDAALALRIWAIKPYLQEKN